MARNNSATWMAALGAAAALGAIMIFIAAQPGAAQKPTAQPAAQKPAAQRPVAQSPAVQNPTAQNPTAQKSTANSVATSNTSITLSGCLEAEGRSFKLTDVKGPQAPKGRSWKTGFIKKTAKGNVEVVSASSNVKLMDHVGHQVTVVGMQAGDDQIRATSVKRMAASCS